MDYRPVIAYIALLVLNRVTESAAKIHTGSWSRKPSWDVTQVLIAISFVLIFIGPVAEYMWFGSRPMAGNFIVGGMLFVLGTVFRTKAHLDLKRGYLMGIGLSEGQKLIDTGLYHIIRHPLYLGLSCLFLACVILLGARVSWLLVAMGVFSVYLRIRKEEEFLEINLPGYRAYIVRTWALIPKVF